jgi:hypothetical protein
MPRYGIENAILTSSKLGLNKTPAVTIEIKFNDNGGVDRVNYYDSDNALIGYWNSDGVSWQAGSLSIGSSLYSNYLLPILTAADLNFYIRNNAYKFNFNNANGKKTSLWLPSILQTGGVTPVDLAAIYVAEGETWRVRANVIGVKTDNGDRGLYDVTGFFYRPAAGNVTQQGATISPTGYPVLSDVTWGLVTLNADTGNQTIDLRVSGKALTTIDWSAEIEFRKL